MPRERYSVHKYFTKSTIEGKNNKSTVKATCVYCKWTTVNNTTRLTKHIKTCLNCPPEIKNSISGQLDATNDEETVENVDNDSVSGDSRDSNPIDGPASKKIKLNQSIENFISRDRTITETQQKELVTLLARAVYCSSTPLSIVENDHWMQFFQKLKPSFKIPSRYELSNNLLNTEYSRVREIVHEKIEAASSLSIQIDGWSNIRRQGIMNIIINTPEPVFYKSIPTGADHHTGENIAEIMISAIKEVGPVKITGLVTDNAANMKLAWKIVQNKYPHITPYGCLLHGLHLFFKDICTQIAVIGEVKNHCSNIVKEIKNSQILLAMFNQKQTVIKEKAKQSGSTAEQPALQLPGKTRFGSIFFCMSSVERNRSALRELCVDETAEKILSDNLKNIILRTNFWEVLTECTILLKPLISWLHIVESDEPRMSLACTAFADIRTKMQNTVNSTFLNGEYDKLNQILEDRYEFCVKPVHYAANLLDPSRRGQDLIPQELLEAQDYLTTLSQFYSDSEGISVEEVLTDSNMFRLKEGMWQKASLNLTVNNMTPYLWWKSCCIGKSVRAMALKILSLPPTSAACERTNSTYKNVHNSTTNRLLTERAGQLAYIKQNMIFLNPKNKPTKVVHNNYDNELIELEMEDEEDSSED